MIAIEADRLFDGLSDQPLEHAVVLVDDGAIVSVGTTGEWPPDAEVVALGDVTLLPGLIDSHSHPVFDASDDPVGHLDRSGDADVLAHCRTAARSALDAGITTVRDLGDRTYVTLRLREELTADPTSGPELRAAGVPITVSSDAGIMATKPHNVLPHGVVGITRVGFSSADALRSVTSVAAESCGLGRRKGRIAVGYDADLIAVSGDPLSDPTAVRQVAAVFRAGRRIR